MEHFNVTLNRNSSKIEGADVDGTLSTNDQTHTLVFTDSTQGWKIVNQDTYIPMQNAFIAATGGTATISGDYKIDCMFANIVDPCKRTGFLEGHGCR